MQVSPSPSVKNKSFIIKSADLFKLTIDNF